QCFLYAMDSLLSNTLKPAEVSDSRPAGYVRALRRTTALREQMRKQLEALGWKVVPGPSISAADRSIDYLNGVHAKGLYLMPAWGGLYRGLDDAAIDAFRRACGPDVRIVPILSSESQRRNGAVRCSVGVYPKP